MTTKIDPRKRFGFDLVSERGYTADAWKIAEALIRMPSDRRRDVVRILNNTLGSAWWSGKDHDDAAHLACAISFRPEDHVV